MSIALNPDVPVPLPRSVPSIMSGALTTLADLAFQYRSVAPPELLAIAGLQRVEGKVIGVQPQNDPLPPAQP